MTIKGLVSTGKLCDLLKDDVVIQEDHYQSWVRWYESLPDHEKVFHLLGAVSQYLLSPDSHATASILATALVCTERWTTEKENDSF